MAVVILWNDSEHITDKNKMGHIIPAFLVHTMHISSSEQLGMLSFAIIGTFNAEF